LLEILKKISQELALSYQQVVATVKLLDEENTVPFIARYRKEWTGSLDEVQIREIERKIKYYRLLEERKSTILESIEKQEKLTPDLKEKIIACQTLQELEDLYLPYKPKKRTRATMAKEKGLEPLAQKIMDEAHPETYAPQFVSEEKKVKNVEEALKGAMDIVAEIVSEEAEIRSFIRESVLKEGIVEAKAKDLKPNSEFDMYKEYQEPVAEIKPHRILAMNRGENLGELSVNILFPDEHILTNMNHYFVIEENPYLLMAIEDGYKRLLKPSIEREIRNILTEKSEAQAITIFSENLGKLLIQPPLKGFCTMGVDPGIRTGTKFAIMDKHGEVLAYDVFFQDKLEESAVKIKDYVKKYKVEVIAVGNGTGFRDVEKLVSATIKTFHLECKYTVIPETGASVYSASDIAREEFPNLDLTIRGAISIGRRLQDPISEYVKIDPKSLGVGQYQHDVDQKKLSEELDKVVEDCVNKIGVNLNTASFSLLKYVSGISSALAKKITLYRKMHGGFKNREEIKKVAGVGPKVFEQAAGFLKVPESSEFLDSTWVHPENYAVAKELLAFKNALGKIVLVAKDAEKIAKQFNIGKTTIEDIKNALEKPHFDPRDEVDKPLLREEVLSLKDLKEGLILRGTVRNVVDFGAFIDIGIKNDGLVHISELSTQFIKHPLEAVKLGDQVEVMVISIDHDRERVGLSVKKVLEHQQSKAQEKSQNKTKIK